MRHAGVYLFDEPLSNLDAQLRAELRVEIKRLHARLGATMIYVTHDQIEALTLADRIAVMQGGVIQQLDTPKKIYREPVNRFVASFVGSPAMNFIPGRIARDGECDFYRRREPARPERLRLPRSAQPRRRPCSASAPSMSRSLDPTIPRPCRRASRWSSRWAPTRLIWCRLADGTAFSFRHDADAQVRDGDTLPVRFPAEALSLFDAKSGQRL